MTDIMQPSILMIAGLIFAAMAAHNGMKAPTLELTSQRRAVSEVAKTVGGAGILLIIASVVWHVLALVLA